MGEDILKNFKNEWHARESILKECESLLESEGLILEGAIADRLKKLYVDFVYKGLVPATTVIIIGRAMLGLGPITIQQLINNASAATEIANEIESLPLQKQQEMLREVKIELKEKFGVNVTPKKETPPVKSESGGNFSKIAAQMIKHEGKKSKMYHDSLGIPTIGVGFNLNRGDAKKILTDLGANYDNIMSGKESLTDDQMKKLLEINIKETLPGIKKTLGINLQDYPEKSQEIIINLVFNMGVGGVSKFTTFLTRFKNKDWKGAADALQYRDIPNKIPTKWFTQVTNGRATLDEIRKVNPKNRAVEILDTLRSM